MEVKYKPFVGITILVLGLANLVLAGMTSFLGSFVVGGIFTILGGLMIVRPALRLSAESIGMKNMLGMEVKTHSGQFEVRDNKVFVDGKKKVSLWMFDVDEATVRSQLQV
jgi:membrane protein CcdC involved in cytochrome C biogenesis